MTSGGRCFQAAALRAALLLRRVGPGLARQLRRQRAAHWLGGRCGRRDGSHRLGRGGLRLLGLQILQTQLQLLDLLLQPLGLAAKLHPLQLQDEQLQVVDFGVEREEPLMLCEDHGPQCVRVETAQIRKRLGRAGHELIISWSGSVLKKKPP